MSQTIRDAVILAAVSNVMLNQHELVGAVFALTLAVLWVAEAAWGNRKADQP